MANAENRIQFSCVSGAWRSICASTPPGAEMMGLPRQRLCPLSDHIPPFPGGAPCQPTLPGSAKPLSRYQGFPDSDKGIDGLESHHCVEDFAVVYRSASGSKSVLRRAHIRASRRRGSAKVKDRTKSRTRGSICPNINSRTYLAPSPKLWVSSRIAKGIVLRGYLA